MSLPEQHPIPSGLDHTTTAAEVVAGLDLRGRRALVTGGYSGIGLAAVRALVDAGAELVLPARRPREAADALAGLPGVTTSALDLADLDSVAAFADALLAEGRPLDVVIGNAGIMALPERTLTPRGWELQLATNHLGHFALVNRLWPLVADGARVVSVSSRGHHYSPMRWDDPWLAADYERYLAYGQSKTANVLFAVHLDLLARERGVRAFSLHPGRIITPLMRYQDPAEFVKAGIIDADGNPIDPTLKSVDQGAATTVWAATSPQLDGLGGLYLEDCDVAVVAPEGERIGVQPYAVDADEAARLWAWSAELTGVDAFS